MVPHVESNSCIGVPVISGRTKTCTDVFFISSFRGLKTRISSNDIIYLENLKPTQFLLCQQQLTHCGSVQCCLLCESCHRPLTESVFY